MFAKLNRTMFFGVFGIYCASGIHCVPEPVCSRAIVQTKYTESWVLESAVVLGLSRNSLSSEGETHVMGSGNLSVPQ